jgi:hypothetical protein
LVISTMEPHDKVGFYTGTTVSGLSGVVTFKGRK